MEEDTKEMLVSVASALLYATAFFVGGCCVGINMTARDCQRQAIEAELGRWTVDPRTGERTFEFGKE